jgi:hypothetical protein
MHDDYAPSLTDWIALLSISTRMIFEKVRERAIKEITARLEKIEAFELIGIAVKYDVEKWLKPAYRRIVTRSQLITHQEALKVSFPLAVMLMRSREQYSRDHQPQQPQQPQSGKSRGFDATVTSNVPQREPPSLDSIIDAEIRVMELASIDRSGSKCCS